ncbi:unnamed protein product [Peronospora destructor]|uniref:Uncharacterized protein n=1 Tax=Peronospora destructor TaxID=86335 RepID=A0AAV0VFS3_9STRA|nr:unnamed protein product [Peronospora destructor]
MVSIMWYTLTKKRLHIRPTHSAAPSSLSQKYFSGSKICGDNKSIDINAKALKSANDAHEDVKDLRKAYGVTLTALAEAFGELGDLDSAIKVFEDAVTRFPNAANMHYNLANMRMARNGSTGDDAFDSVVAQSLERAIKLSKTTQLFRVQQRASPETCDFIEKLASYLAKHNQQPDRVFELRRKADELKFAGIAAVAKSDDEHDQEKTVVALRTLAKMKKSRRKRKRKYTMSSRLLNSIHYAW